jgi:proteic killer suppression protein
LSNQAQTTGDVELPGFRLHSLKGEYRTFYAVDVSGNCRIVFPFDGSDAPIIDLIDYY